MTYWNIKELLLCKTEILWVFLVPNTDTDVKLKNIAITDNLLFVYQDTFWEKYRDWIENIFRVRFCLSCRHFVPNITFGHPAVESLQKELRQDPSFDMHMMVSRPEQWVKPMAIAGANQHTFHLEATDKPGALTKDIWENGMKVGLAIKPGTTGEYLTPWANQS